MSLDNAVPGKFSGDQIIHIIKNGDGNFKDGIGAAVRWGEPKLGDEVMVTFDYVNNDGALAILTTVERLLKKEQLVTREAIMEQLPALVDNPH